MAELQVLILNFLLFCPNQSVLTYYVCMVLTYQHFWQADSLVSGDFVKQSGITRSATISWQLKSYIYMCILFHSGLDCIKILQKIYIKNQLSQDLFHKNVYAQYFTMSYKSFKKSVLLQMFQTKTHQFIYLPLFLILQTSDFKI